MGKYFALLIGLTLAVAGCQDSKTESRDTYTCAMHPTIVSDKPGACPVCGMDLIRKARPGEEVEMTEDLTKLLKSTNESVLASIKTIKGEYRSMPLSIEALGLVTYDTRNIYTISSRVAGRIEKVYLKYEFQKVVKGQKVADIYSPELTSVQRELLFLLENDTENTAMIDAAKNKLHLLGLSDLQITNLTSTKSVNSTISVHSPYSGYLISSQQSPPSSTGSPGMASDEMAGSSTVSNSTPNASTDLLVREGSYASAGQILFRIVNTNDLRIEFNIPSSQSGSIEKGDQIAIDPGNGTKQSTTIDLIEPFNNNDRQFLKIRTHVKKADGMYIGQLVKANINLTAKESLWVPRQSVVTLGLDHVVFIKDHGILKARKVNAGVITASHIEIRSGLASAEEIALDAQYLIDSESFIKTAN